MRITAGVAVPLKAAPPRAPQRQLPMRQRGPHPRRAAARCSWWWRTWWQTKRRCRPGRRQRRCTPPGSGRTSTESRWCRVGTEPPLPATPPPPAREKPGERRQQPAQKSREGRVPLGASCGFASPETHRAVSTGQTRARRRLAAAAGCARPVPGRRCRRWWRKCPWSWSSLLPWASTERRPAGPGH